MKKNTGPSWSRGILQNDKKERSSHKDQQIDATDRNEEKEHAPQQDQKTDVTQWQGYVSLTLALIVSIACWSYLYAFFRSTFNRQEVSSDFGTFVMLLWPLVFWVGGPLCAISGIAAFKTNHPPTRWLILLVSLGPPIVLLGFFVYAFFAIGLRDSASMSHRN